MTHQTVDNELGSFDPERQENVVQSKYATELRSLIDVANVFKLYIETDIALSEIIGTDMLTEGGMRKLQSNKVTLAFIESALAPFQTEGA